jgi:hypothetical protein
MAGGTIGAISTIMFILGIMATKTCRVSIFVDSIHMATLAVHSKMCPGQLEYRIVMVYGDWQPGRSAMADGTIGSISAIMLIF